MHLNNLQVLDLETLALGLPSTSERISSVVTNEGIIKEIKKSQFVRMLDVMILGPAMIYAGTDKVIPKPLKLLLLLTGIGTVIYNGRNYLENERLAREALTKNTIEK